MKKIFKYFLIFLAAIIIGTVILFYRIVLGPLFGQKEKSSEENYKLTQDAIAKLDIAICDEVGTGYMMSSMNPRLDCMKEVIRKSKDYRVCESDQIKYAMRNYIPITRDNCYVELSLGAQDLQICEKITVNKGECIGNIARNTHNIKLCKDQIDPTIREACLFQYPEVEDAAFSYLATKDMPTDFFIDGEDPDRLGFHYTHLPDEKGYVAFSVHSRTNVYYRFFIFLKKDVNSIWKVVYFGQEEHPAELYGLSPVENGLKLKD